MSSLVNGNVHVAGIAAAIEIQSLTRWFGSTCAVNDLSFDVPPGEVIGFIGPNGAGKTTTMRILSTLDEPDWGDALVDGFSVINDPDRVRCRLGFMPDAYGAYPNVSCIEYLDFFARAYGLVGRERMQAIRRVMDFTHMQHMLHKPMTGLSKGMKQRLCLGRALVHNPKVLILDEPAAGLDPRARIELKEMIKTLAADGKSLLISSHILTELAEMCDRVAIIEKGVLLAQGTVSEILRRHLLDTATGNESHVPIVIGVVDEVERLSQWLREVKQLSPLRLDGNLVEVDYSDDPVHHAEFLAELMKAGFRISGFVARQRSLEEAFLRVTKGHVQ